jgi:tetratricopeptide (TPR) repeat protein
MTSGIQKLGLITAVSLVVAVPAPVSANGIAACLKSPDLDDRIAACSRLIREQRGDPGTMNRILRARGVANMRIGQVKQAVTDFTRAIALDKSDFAAHAHRGEASRRLGRTGRAIADLAAAIAMNSSYQPAYYHRGRAYFDKGAFAAAAADFSKAISLKPDHALAYERRGEAFEKLGLEARAKADFDRAARMDPDIVKTRFRCYAPAS